MLSTSQRAPRERFQYQQPPTPLPPSNTPAAKPAPTTTASKTAPTSAARAGRVVVLTIMIGVVSLLEVYDDTIPKSLVQPDRAPTWSYVGRDYHPVPRKVPFPARRPAAKC